MEESSPNLMPGCRKQRCSLLEIHSCTIILTPLSFPVCWLGKRYTHLDLPPASCRLGTGSTLEITLAYCPAMHVRKWKKKKPPTKNKNKSNTHNQRKLQNTSQNWEISVYVTSSCLKPKVQQCCQWMPGLPLAQEKTEQRLTLDQSLREKQVSFPKHCVLPRAPREAVQQTHRIQVSPPITVISKNKGTHRSILCAAKILYY